MAWRYSLGNLLQRAPATPTASGSTADADHTFERLGDGQVDDPAMWQLETDGVYAAVCDLSQLATSSARADAPTGWADLPNRLAGTPGLPANPPDRGTYATRANTVRAYRAIYQDVRMYPGETSTLRVGLYRPAGSDVTRVAVRVVDLKTGKSWDGTGAVWASNADAGEVSADDTWEDVDVDLDASEAEERTTFRVIAYADMPGASGPTTYFYASDPVFLVGQNVVALVGHNLPSGAVVTWSDGTATWTVPITLPTGYYVANSPVASRLWTLTITYPAGTALFAERPRIGELWAGLMSDLVWCPGYPFDVAEADLGQTRLEGGRGREAAYTDTERAARKWTMRFRASQDGYEHARDGILRATRWGVDPLMLFPVSVIEGGAPVHGRLAPDFNASYISNTRRTYELALRESPFARG